MKMDIFEFIKKFFELRLILTGEEFKKIPKG